MGYRVETIIEGASELGTKASYVGFLQFARVYAEWSVGTTRGRVAVRHSHTAGLGKQDAGTLNSLSTGRANSVRIDGPCHEVEAEITRAVEDGTVTVTVIAFTDVG